jgi:hypothetical protein
LVGPNNSGKSTILEFFYELRDVFAQMRGGMLRFTSSGSHNQPIGYLIAEASGIFSRNSSGPRSLVITLSGDDASPPRLHNGVQVFAKPGGLADNR